MPEPWFELQAHSTCSDGELSPESTVAAARDAGVELLALTDHDSTDGVAAAAAAATDGGPRLIPAVEISVLDPAARDIHICGYMVDPLDIPLARQLERSRADRVTRAERMVAALQDLGWLVDAGPLDARRAAGNPVGRPHVAAAVVSHPGNAERLKREGLDDPSAFLVAYLIEGRPAFRERDAPSTTEAVDLIHRAGGIAVWAHPFWDIQDEAGVLATADRFREAGIDGIEAFYVTHTQPQTELLHRYCREHGLLTTGSSDFHGPNHQRFNRFRAFETFGLDPILGPLLS